MTLSLKYVYSLLVRMGFFFMGKVVRRWMDILHDGQAWCFSSKRKLLAIYWYFYHKLHLIRTSNRKFHSLFPSHT